MEAVDYVHDSKTFSIWNQKQTTHFAQIEKDVDSFFASRPGVFCSKVIFLANNKGRFFFKKKDVFYCEREDDVELGGKDMSWR